MGPHTELFQVLKSRFPDVSQDEVAALTLRITEPERVLANMSHLTVYYIDEGPTPYDKQFTSLVPRDRAEVRVVLIKGATKVFLGPSTYDRETTPPSVSWDGRCTCGRWESSSYFAEENAQAFIDEARAHLEKRH